MAERSPELRELEEEAARLREELRREIRARADLLTVVSHELRTPVTVLAGYTRLLLSEEVGELNPRQRRYLEECRRSCERLNAFIANLLHFSQLQGGGVRVEPEDASVREAVEGACAFLRPLVEEHRSSLEIDVAEDAVRARFDPPRIEQVLCNLLENALKYTEPGSRIRVVARRVCEQGRPFVEVSVIDDGPGVPPEDRERIFEPYVRGGGQRGSGGLGLGLSICREIVRGHGGRIRVSDAAGGGACFSFTLPVDGERPRAAGAEAERE